MWVTDLVGGTVSRMDPGANEVVEEIRTGRSDLGGLAVGEGSVWVTSVNAKLLRVNPGTNGVTARTDIGDYSFDVEAGAGHVWAHSEVNVNSAGGYTIRLSRLEGESGEVSGHLDQKNMSGLAVGGGAVWAGISDTGKGESGLIKISP